MKHTQNNDSKKTIVIIGSIVMGVFLLFAIKGWLSTPSQSLGLAPVVEQETDETNDIAVRDGVQEVTLSLDSQLNYKPNPIKVKVGVPVRMVVDLSSVRGCTTSISMPSFGVQKRAVPGDNVIEFTPQKTGRFPFSCSMGMAQGVVVVV